MSKIQAYFTGKTVLMTGATGFLGKALIEKMLRSLPGLRRLYLLIRPRRSHSHTIPAADRFRNELLRSSIFTRLKQEQGDQFEEYVTSRISVVAGELTEERLGVSSDDYRRLAAEVEVIINSAAVVVFDERLDLALNLNTLGARRMLDFARDCPRLQAVIHISTCYVSGSTKGWVPESVAPFPFDVEKEIRQMSAQCTAIKQRHTNEPRVAHEKLVELGLQRARARGWHDTYTFTKALGEQLIVKYRGDLPTVILRPSIIESTLSEPEPGWIDGFRMGDPLFVGYGKGQLQDFPARPDTISDIIPCDHVVNAVLAAVPRCAAEGGFRVYQVATGEQNPVRFSTIYDVGKDYFTRNPMYERDGKPIPTPNWSFPDVASYRRKLFWQYRVPLKAALAVLKPFSFIQPLDRRRRRLAVRRASLDLLSYYVDIYSPYMAIESRYVTRNTAELWSSLSPADQQLFNFDVRTLDWRDYFANVHLPGLKRNVLNLTEDKARESNGARGLRRRQPPGPTDTEAGAPASLDDEEEEAGVPLHQATGILKVPGTQTNGRPTQVERPVSPGNQRWDRVLTSRTIEDQSHWLESSLTKESARIVMRQLMRLYYWAWFGFEAHGTENLPQGAFIVAANHASHLDTGAVVTAFGRRGRELVVMGARDYFFNHKLRGWMFHTFLNVVPFDRTQNMIKGLQLARSVLRSGRPVLIFPEGKRSVTGELQPFKAGIGLLGLELGVPIVPCCIEGSHAALPKGRSIPRRAHIRVTFAPPITMDRYRTQQSHVERRRLYRQIAADVRLVVESLRNRQTT